MADGIPSGALVLVTGGAGFIGSHLVDTLVLRGARVRVLDDLSNGHLSNLSDAGADVEFVEGDIRDLEVCRRACEGASLVFHEAARGSVPRSMKDPAGTLSVNALGTVNVFTAARDAGVRRVVYASSSSVYGDSSALPKREGEEGRVLSPYALSKRMNEETAEAWVRYFGMQIVGLRYFNVFGPRQDPAGPYAAVIPRFFSACLRGEAPVIYGDGLQSRDFTFVGDAVAANLAAAAAPDSVSGKAYNVAGGAAITVRDLAEAVRKAAGRGVDPVFEPERPGDVRHSLADLSRSRAELGFEPVFSVEDGLRRAAEWYTR